MNSLTLETVQWANLKDIDDIDPISGQDLEVLAELREVLVKRGATDRFGVCLLHKHFEIAEGEIVLEETDVESRISTLSVERDTGSKNTIETMWKFSEEIRAETQCVLRCDYNNGHRAYHSKEST